MKKEDREISEKQVYDLDEEQIQKEEMYDGFYAVVTNLEGDVSEIIKINKQRWEIEENFRIMKTEFEANKKMAITVSSADSPYHSVCILNQPFAA